MVKLYTIGCPTCLVLERKLKEKNIDFEVCEDKDEIVEVGRANHIMSAPILQVDDTFMKFADALKWANSK